MSQSLLITLHCTDFPGHNFECRGETFLGVQRNKEVLFETPADSREARFELAVKLKTGKDGRPNFLGPYVFGKTGDKFLYLSWYTRAGTEKQMFRRAKIKLNTLSWERINAAIALGQGLQAHVKLTDGKGGPVCASLKGDHIYWEE